MISEFQIVFSHADLYPIGKFNRQGAVELLHFGAFVMRLSDRAAGDYGTVLRYAPYMSLHAQIDCLTGKTKMKEEHIICI